MMPSKQTLVTLLLFALAVGCTYTSDIKDYTYDAYIKTEHFEIIDLVGAREISLHYEAQRELSDRWFSFKISREDFTSLVASVAATNNGPSQISWADNAVTPEKWKPRHSPPSWWQIPSTTDLRSTFWCYESSSNYYNGWYFCHDHSTGEGICWHWCYQHGFDMCDE